MDAWYWRGSSTVNNRALYKKRNSALMESYKEMNGNKKVWTNDAYFQKAKRPKLRAVRISKIAIFFKRLNAQF
jgi:hypothetical protein